MKYEYEMYPVIERYFSALGYDIKAEVNKVDVVGVKSDHIIAIEMKLKLSVKLIYQAIERQTYVDDVYIATVASKNLLRDLDNLQKLVRRLHLGLILLYERESGVWLEVVEVPKFSQFIYNKKRSAELLSEFYGRRFNLNTGGISKKPVASAYREKNINIAALLIKNEGEMSIALIRNLTNILDCAKILQANFYGFFKRTKRGHYRFDFENEKGLCEYQKFIELSNFYEDKYEKLLRAI